MRVGRKIDEAYYLERYQGPELAKTAASWREAALLLNTEIGKAGRFEERCR
jgi:hypothetical protein